MTIGDSSFDRINDYASVKVSLRLLLVAFVTLHKCDGCRWLAGRSGALTLLYSVLE